VEDIIPIIFMVAIFALMIVTIIGMYKAFEKAGLIGIACIVPIWNIICIVQLAGKPIWWLVLFFIPIVSIIVAIVLNIAIAENYGKSAGFGIGLAFLPFIFWPILGFGDAKYRGAPL